MSEADAGARFFRWLWEFVKGYGPQSLTTAATIVSLVWGVQEKPWTDAVALFWIAIGLTVLAVVAQFALQRPTYMALAEEKRQATERSTSKAQALESAMESLLRQLTQHCEVDGDDERASVYYHHGDQFVMIARWSSNPVLCAPGRRVYPDTQGVIGQTWSEAPTVLLTLPPTEKRWNGQVKSSGFSDAEIAGLTMRSRKLAGVRMFHQHRAVGVIVFESLGEQTITQRTIDMAQSSMLFAVLSELVAVAAEMTPRGEQVVATSKSGSMKPWQANVAA